VALLTVYRLLTISSIRTFANFFGLTISSNSRRSFLSPLHAATRTHEKQKKGSKMTKKMINTITDSLLELPLLLSSVGSVSKNNPKNKSSWINTYRSFTHILSSVVIVFYTFLLGGSVGVPFLQHHVHARNNLFKNSLLVV
jgi:hypothetical protein